MGDPDTLTLLREQIHRIERCFGNGTPPPVQPTGFAAIDAHLGGGLERGAVHELFGAGCDPPVAVKPSRFVASILAAATGQVIWISDPSLNLHPAGLHQGRIASRASHLRRGTQRGNPWAMREDVLRKRGVGAVVADLSTPMTLTASRRLQLAAEHGQGLGFLRACATRWRVRAAPCASLYDGETGGGSLRMEAFQDRRREPRPSGGLFQD